MEEKQYSHLNHICKLYSSFRELQGNLDAAKGWYEMVLESMRHSTDGQAIV